MNTQLNKQSDQKSLKVPQVGKPTNKKTLGNNIINSPFSPLSGFRFHTLKSQYFMIEEGWISSIRALVKKNAVKRTRRQKLKRSSLKLEQNINSKDFCSIRSYSFISITNTTFSTSEKENIKIR